MKYFKNAKNKIFAFDDDTDENIIRESALKNGGEITEISYKEYMSIISPSITTLKKRKILEMRSLYLKYSQEDIEYSGSIFQADEKSKSMMVSVLSVGSVPDGFYWVDAKNNKVQMTHDDLRLLSFEILKRTQLLFDNYQIKKSEVLSAENESQIKNIEW